MSKRYNLRIENFVWMGTPDLVAAVCVLVDEKLVDLLLPPYDVGMCYLVHKRLLIFMFSGMLSMLE